MNKFFRNTMLLLGGLLVLAFTSCKNFLNANETKRQIEETIAYANAKECTIFIKTVLFSSI